MTMASCKQPRRSTRNYMPVAMEWKRIDVDAAHTSKAVHPTTRAEWVSPLPAKVVELEEEIARLKLITGRIHKNLETGKNSVLQRDCGEKQALLKENRQLRHDLRALKINSTRQKRDYEAAMKLEVDKLSEERKLQISTIQELEKELQAVKIADEKLKKERKLLIGQNRVLKNDVRTMKDAITRLKKKSEEGLKTEVEKITKEREVFINQILELQKQLHAVKDTSEKLKNDLQNEMNIIQQRHDEEKEYLKQENRRLKMDVRAMRKTNTKSKKTWELELQRERESRDKESNVLMCQIKDLQEQLQVVMETNTKSKKTWESELQRERESRDKEKNVLMSHIKALQEQLQVVMVAKDVLQRRYEEQIDTEQRNHLELLKLFMKENEALKDELEAVKARGSPHNLQMVGDSSEPQEVHLYGEQPEKDAVQQQVSLASFHPIRVLGEGGFGKVILAKKKSSGGCSELYALKMLKKTHVASYCDMSNIMAEKEALILASGNPFITTLHSCFQTKYHLFFVLDFMSGGDLKDQLRRQHIFPEKRAQFYAAEVTLALQFLHKHGIVHRDLKLENILLGGDGHVKLADFGLARLGMFRGARVITYCGTPCYMAPEMVHRSRYGRGVDWWGLGVILYEMLTGEPPFYERHQCTLEEKIRKAEVTYPRWLSRKAKLIISKLLKKDPSQRLGSHGDENVIRQQPFFQGIDWNALKEKRVKPPDTPETLAESKEDDLTFKDLLNPGNARCIIDQEEFEGFSFMNYGQLNAKPARTRQ